MAVADTWNGRVQLFDAAGRFLWSWGRSAFAVRGESAAGDTDRLFGPRAVAFDPSADRLVVADTGNRRLLELSREGELLREVLAPGGELGGFAEPIGLAFRPEDGALFVADVWNRRLLAAKAGLGEWRVAQPELWSPKSSATTPYLAAAGATGTLLTDPDRDRLLFAGRGEAGDNAVVLARSGELELVDPVGVAVAADGRIWVTSRRDGTLWRLPPLGDCEYLRPAVP
jgi:sugar lactone lactonase YvrE